MLIWQRHTIASASTLIFVRGPLRAVMSPPEQLFSEQPQTKLLMYQATPAPSNRNHERMSERSQVGFSAVHCPDLGSRSVQRIRIAAKIGVHVPQCGQKRLKIRVFGVGTIKNVPVALLDDEHRLGLLGGGHGRRAVLRVLI